MDTGFVQRAVIAAVLAVAVSGCESFGGADPTAADDGARAQAPEIEAPKDEDAKKKRGPRGDGTEARAPRVRGGTLGQTGELERAKDRGEAKKSVPPRQRPPTGGKAKEQPAEKRDEGIVGRDVETGTRGAGQTARQVPPMAVAPVLKPGPDSNALVGKSKAELARLLGTPSEVRNEPPAVVWYYRTERCSLDVFLYFDVGQNGFRSLAYKFYPETRVERVERECLAGIRSDRNQGAESN